MNVIRADVMGMCFGVRDALKVIAEINDPTGVTIHGELVHNEEILSGLGARGFGMVGEGERGAIPATPSVLITAHGVSDRERARLATAGKHLIDTTCPLVTRAHRAARGLHDLGYFVVVIGRRGHVEVEGIVGDLERFAVVGSADEVTTYPADRIGVVCQTTVPTHKAALLREAIEARNPDAQVRFVDTVCRPTKDHQRSLVRLVERVDAVVVVGGRNSNNTRELVTLCRDRGLPVVHVQSAGDLEADWFRNFETVGLTAGTSTPDETIDEVDEALRCLPVGVTAS